VNDRGGVIKPEHTPINYEGILNFGVQRYRTSYDVSYPVLVTLRDPQALDGQGYTFAFALESNIRNNQPAEADSTLPPPRAIFEKSMLCDSNKRSTGNLRLTVVDSETLEPLDHVGIAFTVPGQATCPMGWTDEQGVLETPYPAVYGGVLNFMKKDYLMSFYPIDTYPLKGKDAAIGYVDSTTTGNAEPIPLHKYKNILVTVKKKNIEKCIVDSDDERQCYYGDTLLGGNGVKVFSAKVQLDDDTEETHEWYYTGVTQPLEDNEQAIFTLKLVRDVRERIFHDEISTVIIVNGDEPFEARLVPGVYEVNGQLIKNEEVVIPEEERCGGGIVFDIGEECVTIEQTEMEQFPAGSILWNSSRTYLTITPEQLYGSSELVLYIPYQHIENVPVEEHVRVMEDMQLMGKMMDISQMDEVRESLEPTFR
jgi:hypothetical protein